MSQILLSAAHQHVIEDARSILERAGHPVAWHAIHDEIPDAPDRFRAIIVAANGDPRAEVNHCRTLRTRLRDNPVPILFIGRATSERHQHPLSPPGERGRGEGAHVAPLHSGERGRGEGAREGPTNDSLRQTALEAGADVYLSRPLIPREFLAQVHALLRLKHAHDRLLDRSSEVALINKKLHQTNQQMNAELALARRIQLSFLPQKMPDVAGVRFAVHYDLCGQVGGDFYDVFRLDEEHVGFYVADAMGHGLPASLLTIFVKKGARTKEVNGHSYRLVPPNEVLEHLNRDLIEQQLAESPFITMVYGLLNVRTGLLKFARAGHPHPIRIPAAGDAHPLHVHGSLMGVFDTTFAIATAQVERGDTVLFYSDGIENAVWSGRPAGTDSLIACAVHHRQLPITDLVDRLAIDLFGTAGPSDDLTLLAIHYTGS